MDALDRYQDAQAKAFQEGLANMAKETGVDPLSDEVSLQEKMDAIKLTTTSVEFTVDRQFFFEDIDVALKSITSMVRGLRKEQTLEREMLSRIKLVRNKLSAIKGVTKQNSVIENTDLQEVNFWLGELTKLEVEIMKTTPL